MVQISIGKNQGITQAIRDKIGASNIKNSDLGTWQKVMTEVNAAKESKSIFKSGKTADGNAYTTDASKLGDSNTYHSNYVVDQGTIEIDDGIWSKIQKLLTSSKDEQPSDVSDSKPELPREEPSSPTTEKPETKVVAGKIYNRAVDGEKQNIAVVKQDGKKVRYAVNEDGTLGDTLAATKTFGNNKYISGDFPPETRIFEREVNGKKSQIGVYHDENGNKVRKLVTKDAKTGKTTLGESLVTVSSVGKNKYITQSQFETNIRQALGLANNQQIPTDIKASYVDICGEPTLIFKKGGKTMDKVQLAAYIADWKEHLAEVGD